MVSLSKLFPADLPRAAGPIGPVEAAAVEQHRRWIAAGHHGDMAYLDRYDEVRADPRLLLEGARSIICVAFPYFTDEPVELPVSLYARGRDYHEVVRERLRALAALLPGESRVCVDTAPLRERYWAARLGLGFVGRNNQLIIPSLGSYFFLGFIITTAEVESESPAAGLGAAGCDGCRRCVDACPGGCLFADGAGVDARRCLSYLTIEYRGELSGELLVLYGCDVCQRVCPHNRGVRPTPIADFHPSAEMMALTAADVASMTPERFSALFRHSAIKRTRLAGLQRNLTHLKLPQK